MTEIPCRICGSTAPEIGEKTGFAIHRCGECRFVMATPLDGDYRASIYDDYGGTPMYRSKIDKKIKRAGKRIRRYAPLARGGRRFLDIGCSIGTAVEAARRSGFDAMGIDLDGHAIEEARVCFPQARFEKTTAEETADQDRKFDFIYSSEVIEHISHPLNTLKAMKSMLAPDGVIWITTPDSGHPRTPKDIIDWIVLCPPNHISLFTRRSIKIALDKAGLRLIKFEFNFKPGIKLVAAHA